MIKVGDIEIGGGSLVFILGPCMMESKEMVMEIATTLKNTCPFPFIFKTSFDKANRSSINSDRGIGLEAGLSILEQIKYKLNLLTTTDIHLPEQAESVGAVCDMIQIPAFLCRQTDLLIAAANTNKPVNVKKGQFLSPQDMKNVVEKIRNCGNSNILLTDRGTSFGYNNLISDMRAIPIMKNLGCPVCFDASHSVQCPGAFGDSSGGERQFTPTLAKAAVAAGADVIFIETHQNPEKAKSDSAIQWPLDKLLPLLKKLNDIYNIC